MRLAQFLLNRRAVVIPLCLLLSSMASSSLAQDVQPASGQIRGQVVEARTAAPLPAVLVQVEATRQRAISDGEGRFTIDTVPVGSQTLIVSVVGFGLVRRTVTVATGGVDVTLPVAEGASTYVEELAVSAGRFRDAQPGAASQALLGSRELLALRGVIADDPFRAVQVLPGVAAGDDYRAEFAVRGLGPSHVGLAIDDVDSPLLFHTVRGVQDTGSLALINSDILEEATLLSGVHAQRLGSHLGARLDFRTRDGARDRLHVRALVSGSATTTVWEGPLGAGNKGSWLVAGRKSYIDWLLRRIDTSIDGTFGFSDAQGKLTVNLTPAQTLRISLIGGKSELDEDDDATPTAFDKGHSRTLIGNLQWRFAASPRFSIAQQLYVVDARYVNRVVDGRPREEGGDRDVTWRGTLEWSPAAVHVFEFAAQAHTLGTDRIDRRFFGASDTTTLDAHVDTNAQAAWVSYRWTPSSRFVVAPGARVERWSLIHHTAASPWLLGEWQLAPATRLRGGMGVQRQAPTVDDTLLASRARPLVPERAYLTDVGVEQRLGEVWRASMTGYYRAERDRLRLIDNEVRIVNGRLVRPSAQGYIDSVMDGRARGIETILERRAATGLTGWLSYAWGSAENTDRGERLSGRQVAAETFAADWDQRHTVNLNVGYRWSERSSISARYRYGSNFPLQGYFAPLDDGHHIVTSARNTGRLPAYSRLDVRADRTVTYRRSRLTMFAEVINALSHANYRTQGATLDLRTGVISGLTEKLFPLLPSAGILIEF